MSEFAEVKLCREEELGRTAVMLAVNGQLVAVGKHYVTRHIYIIDQFFSSLQYYVLLIINH